MRSEARELDEARATVVETLSMTSSFTGRQEFIARESQLSHDICGREVFNVPISALGDSF